MANSFELQHAKKIIANWNSTAKQFNGVMVFNAFFNAAYIPV